jgi:hypothetical protein
VTGHRGGVALLLHERRNVKSTTLGKEELFGTNSLKKGAVRHVDSLIGNVHEISNNATAVAK